MGNFFTSLANQLLAPFDTFSALASAGLTSAAIPAVLAGLSINIAWQGLNLVRGVGGQHLFLDLFAQNLRAVLVLLLALGVGSGYSSLVAAVTELQTSLVGYASPGASATSAPAALDAQLEQLVSSYKTLLQAGLDHIDFSALGGGDFSGLEVIAVGTLVALALLLFMAFAFVEIVAIQAAFYMISAIGPLFVAAAAFRETASYFSGWLNGLVRYAIEIAFALALVGIGLKTTGQINTNLAADLNGGDLSTQLDLAYLLLEAVATAVILVYLSLKVDSIAASVFGGASVSGAAVALAAAAGAVMGGRAGRGSSASPSGVHGGGEGLSDAVERGMARALEANALDQLAGRPGTGTIVAGAGRQGIDTLGPDWTND